MPFSELHRFALQRVSGAVLAVLMIVHLAAIIYAVQDGLSVAEITGRLQASPLWQLMYGVLFVAAITHASIGIRNVIAEIRFIPDTVRAITVCAYAIGTAMLGIWAMTSLVALS